MELTHLKYFVAVADELHFGNAAKKLNIAQPPLSQQIMKLEDELGVKLFHRTSRSVKLTDEGQLFLEEARIILKRSENAVSRVRDYALSTYNRLSIGFNEPAINTFLPEAVVSFRKKYPEINLQLHELTTLEQLQALENGSIDIGFLRPFQHDLTNFKTISLFEEPYCLVFPEKHKLLRELKSEFDIPLNQLKDIPLILFPREVQPELFDTIVKRCEKSGFTPNIIQETRTKHTAFALVKGGLGVALVPKSTSNLAPKGLVSKPLQDKLPPVKIVAVLQQSVLFPELNQFINLVTENNLLN